MSTSFPVGDVRVRFGGDTHVGMRRTHNEDSLYMPESERLCLVADGMGGHASGEVASRLAIDTIVEHFRTTEQQAPPTWPFPLDWGVRRDQKRLGAAIRLANLRIMEESRANPKFQGMGTTVVAALFVEEGVHLAHVGDSRIYRLRDGQLEQLTEDHSLYAEYVALRRADAGNEGAFPQKNVLVRALGMREFVHVDQRTEGLQMGDLFVLCTDGLSGMISDDAIRAVVVEEKDMDRACERLIDAANRGGGHDNITVALARVERL